MTLLEKSAFADEEAADEVLDPIINCVRPEIRVEI